MVGFEVEPLEWQSEGAVVDDADRADDFFLGPLDVLEHAAGIGAKREAQFSFQWAAVPGSREDGGGDFPQ